MFASASDLKVLKDAEMTERDHCSGDLSSLLALERVRSCIAGLKESLDLGKVGGVSDEVRELLPHALLRELVETVELVPELLLNGHSSDTGVELDVLEVHGVEDAHGALEALISLKVSELTSLGKNEQAEGGVINASDKVREVGGVLLSNDASLDLLGKADSEGVLAVVLPHALEVGLF